MRRQKLLSSVPNESKRLKLRVYVQVEKMLVEGVMATLLKLRHDQTNRKGEEETLRASECVDLFTQ